MFITKSYDCPPYNKRQVSTLHTGEDSSVLKEEHKEWAKINSCDFKVALVRNKSGKLLLEAENGSITYELLDSPDPIFRYVSEMMR